MEPNSTDLSFMTVEALGSLLDEGAASSAEVVAAQLDRIARFDEHLRAYVTVTADRALAAAREADRELGRGERRGPLHGLGIAHKDNVDVAGVPTTAACRALEANFPLADAAIAAALSEAGTVMLGKANLHELACGAMQGYGVTRNAWDPNRAAGGSSSGSATAVAAGLAVAATGSETGGSIRVPASFSGLVGFKPTSGSIDSAGFLPISETLDTPAWLTRTAHDALLILQSVTGRANAPRVAETPSMSGTTVGLAAGALSGGVDGGGVEPEVAAAISRAADEFSALGAAVVEVELPALSDVAAAHHATWLYEAVRCLGHLLFDDEVQVGSVVRNRLRPGALLTAPDYAVAQRLRAKLGRELSLVLERVDVVLCPVTPFPAYRLDEFAKARNDVSRFNRLTNLTGNPALSLPCGFDREGMPLGMQLIGRLGGDLELLRVAMAYQRTTSWHERRPDAAERYVAAVSQGEAPPLLTGKWPAGATGLSPLLPEMLPTVDLLRARAADAGLGFGEEEILSSARQLHPTLAVLAAGADAHSNERL